MNYHIVSLFPQSLNSYLNESIIKRAQEDNLVKIKFYNPRDFTSGSSYADRRVDDKPYGGGPGMVIEALPVIKAIESALQDVKDKKKSKIVWFTPSGKQFDTKLAKNYSKKIYRYYLCMWKI
jgi:tRNA (guanine37-N1)-methyltransferase